MIHNNGVGKKKFSCRNRDKLGAIRKSCTKFFMEVVSGLCFRQSSAPEDQLVVMLFDIVFTEQREVDEGGEGERGRHGTRDLTPFSSSPADKQPVIRSFLLQLLLQHEYVIEFVFKDQQVLTHTCLQQH